MTLNCKTVVQILIQPATTNRRPTTEKSGIDPVQGLSYVSSKMIPLALALGNHGYVGLLLLLCCTVKMMIDNNSLA